jgi:hypothetical protein
MATGLIDGIGGCANGRWRDHLSLRRCALRASSAAAPAVALIWRKGKQGVAAVH